MDYRVLSDFLYDLPEWRDSLEQAECADWKGDDPDLVDWPLAKWLCDLKDSNEFVAADTDIISAIINLLDLEGVGSFSPDFINKVLASEKGKANSSFEDLCWEHTEDNYHPGDSGDPREELEALVAERDFEKWYKDNVQLPSEVCAEASSGGTLYWFNKSRW